MNKGRISVLDSFRAIAILSVLLFHFFSRWTFPINKVSLYPYNDQYSYFQYCHLGVEFFFIISGFVIFFTLENTFNFTLFWKKRIIRLLPSAIIASLLTFSLFNLFDKSNIFPFSHAVKSFIPSIFFVSPQLISLITGDNNWGYIDGSYWSLWPEIQFYLISSILYYFTKGDFKRNFVIFSSSLIIFNTIIKFLEHNNKYVKLPGAFVSNYEKWVINGFSLINYLPFFSLGIVFYILYKNHNLNNKNLKYIKIYAIFLMFYILCISGGLDTPLIVRIVYGLMIVIFFIFIYSPNLLHIFENKFLSKIGESSYFLYLIHQNIGVLVIYYLGKYPLRIGFMLPIIVSLLLIEISVFYSVKIDKKINKWLKLKVIESSKNKAVNSKLNYDKVLMK